MQNAVGYADVATLGPRVALGTDGMDGDIFAEARAAHLCARDAYGPERGIDAVGLVAATGRLAGEALGRRGEDWVVLDYDPPTPLSAENLAGHFLFGLGARHVRDVVAGGELIVEKRSSTRVDEAEVRARWREEAARLWERMR